MTDWLTPKQRHYMSRWDRTRTRTQPSVYPDDVARLLAHAAEADRRLAALTAERDRMVVANKALHDEGVAYLDRAMKAEAERDAMRPVVEMAERNVRDGFGDHDLKYAVDAYRAEQDGVTG